MSLKIPSEVVMLCFPEPDHVDLNLTKLFIFFGIQYKIKKQSKNIIFQP